MSEHTPEQDCDVVVIGTGPGGEALASRLAGEGLDVVAVEARLVGGECPYWGCIPSKMMLRAAQALAEARRVDQLAGWADVAADFATVARRIREEATDGWDDRVAVERLTGAGVTFVRGRGRLAGERVVEVEETGGGHRRFRAGRAVVLNPGTRAATPPIDGLAETPFWTNHEALEARELPATLAVVGGGPIGVELAQAYARFGSQVTLLEVGPRVLGPEEPESGELLARVLAEEGVDVRSDVTLRSVTHGASGFVVELEDGEVRAEQLLVAAGRRPNIDDIGLESVGVTPGRSLPVGDDLRVQDGAVGEWLWAIGDVVGRGAFTHVSMYQSDRAARAVLGEELPAYDATFPRTTFTEPEIGAVGLTEKQARDQGLDVRTGLAPLPESTRGWLHGPGNDGFVKVVVDATRGVLVGATFAGPSGGESVSGLGVAVRAEVPIATLRNSVFAYPTFWRAVETALGDLD